MIHATKKRGLDTDLFNAYVKARESGEKATERKLLNKILVSQEYFVRFCAAKSISHGASDYKDLRQAARIGIVKALERFDPSRGSWSSYARQWIRAEMIRGVVEGRSMVHVPANPSAPQTVIRQMDAIRARTGREAAPEELRYTERSGKVVEVTGGDFQVWALAASGLPRELTQIDGDDMPAEERTHTPLTNTFLRALEGLSTLERNVLLSRVVEGRTFDEIAAEAKFSRAWILGKYELALAKMRFALGVSGAIECQE